MSIDHKVSFSEILYDLLTMYQYDTGSKAHIAYYQKNLKAQMLSYNSSVSVKWIEFSVQDESESSGV